MLGLASYVTCLEGGLGECIDGVLRTYRTREVFGQQRMEEMNVKTVEFELVAE